VRALVKPVREGLFAGALAFCKVPSSGDRFMFRLSVLFGVWSEGAHRDWGAIRAWALSLPPLLPKWLDRPEDVALSLSKGLFRRPAFPVQTFGM